MPLAWPIGLENIIYAAEIRQMFVGRYWVIFSVDKRTVRILHLRGAFVDSTQRPFEEDE